MIYTPVFANFSKIRLRSGAPDCSVKFSFVLIDVPFRLGTQPAGVFAWPSPSVTPVGHTPLARTLAVAENEGAMMVSLLALYLVALPIVGAIWIHRQIQASEHRTREYIALRERLHQMQHLAPKRRAEDQGRAPFTGDHPKRRSTDLTH